ncbi:MAG: type II secretion system GspH family protein [Candidatus Kaiserbacteria bacterium]|nr:type II secretion system GspH family protein [Candidatus Kaiserbacteria bacterium]
MNTRDGFTILELLVVITIVGIISAVILGMINESRIKGRDGSRKAQTQELLKALELYYTENGVYPLYGAGAGAGGYLSGIQPAFFGNGTSFKRLPKESNSRFFYCVSNDQKTILLAVDTEDDKGGTNYCRVTRGSGPYYGCPAIEALATDTCASRF